MRLDIQETPLGGVEGNIHYLRPGDIKFNTQAHETTYQEGPNPASLITDK